MCAYGDLRACRDTKKRSAIQQRRDFVPIVMMLLRARFERLIEFDHQANLGGGGGGGAPLGGNPGGNAPGGGGAAYPP